MTPTGWACSGATLRRTLLVSCRGLHEARGLDEVIHAGPSSLDAETLRESLTGLSDSFLRGAGYSAEEIGALRAVFAPAAFHAATGSV